LDRFSFHLETTIFPAGGIVGIGFSPPLRLLSFAFSLGPQILRTLKLGIGNQCSHRTLIKDDWQGSLTYPMLLA
jgi:hypothetical protein